MRHALLFFTLLINTAVFAQVQDTTTSGAFNVNSTSAFNHKKEIHYIVRENVVLAMSKLFLTPSEDQIFNLEVQECNAVLKRDTARLMQLWQKDFTLDVPAKEIVQGKNLLPYYVSLNRAIEKLTVMENVVFVSGNETYREIKPDGKLSDPEKRNFFHTWTFQNGNWKLTTRSFD